MEYSCEPLPEHVHPGVCELTRYRGNHWKGGVVCIPHLAIALELLANLRQRLLRAPAVELVEHDDVRGIQHLELLKLTGSPILTRRDVHRHICYLSNGVVTLADAAGLHEHHVKAHGLTGLDGPADTVSYLTTALPARERAHEQVLVGERIHPDAIP